MTQPLAHPEPEAQGYQPASVQRWRLDGYSSATDQVIEESAVALIYNGISHAVMMATPCDLEDFAVGFSLSEGIVDCPEDIYGIDVVAHPSGYEVQLEISSSKQVALKSRKRSLAGRTGCGLCGAESLAQAIRPISSVEPGPLPSAQAIQRAAEQLDQWQHLQALTGACHSAAWCDSRGENQLIREDVGRHNALDKLIGALLRQQLPHREGFVMVSSRASYEMVQKAARLGGATLVAVSAPTQLAIEQAREAQLNLVGFARPGRHTVYVAANNLEETNG